jgi:predicted transcriptional regulator
LSKTRIVYQVNLYIHTANKHLAGLMVLGLLDQFRMSPHPVYQITLKGQDALVHMAQR